MGLSLKAETDNENGNGNGNGERGIFKSGESLKPGIFKMGNPQNRECLKTGKRLLGHWAFDVNSIISGFNQTEQKENDTVNQGSISTRKGGKCICFSLNIIKTKMCARQLTPNRATN